MFGLMFLVVLAVWAVIAVVVGFKMPKWFGIKRHHARYGILFALLVFVMPIADEIIAWPQMQALCASQKPYEMVSGMDEKKAFGRTVEQTLETAEETLFPPTVSVTRWSVLFVDTTTKEPVLSHYRFEPRRGMLGVPNGSSGGTMTVLLKNCIDVNEKFDSNGLPTRYSSLSLKRKPSQ